MANEIRIENVTQVKKFLIKSVEQVIYRKVSNVLDMSIPEEDEDETILTKMEGVKMTITLEVTLVASDVDLSEGTDTSGVYTVLEQKDFLMSNFCTANISDNFRYTEVDSSWSKDGVIESIDVSITGNVGKLTVTFKVGEVV